MAKRVFSRGPRRKTQWAGFGDNAGAATLPDPVTINAGNSAILSYNMIVAGGAGLVDEEVTICRVVGRATAHVNFETANSSAAFAMGLAVVRNEALAAGTGSMPDPETDPDFEWLYYHVGQLYTPGNTNRDGPLSGYTWQFDVRGMRVVRAGQTVVWIGEAETNACWMGVGGRYLCKLT